MEMEIPDHVKSRHHSSEASRRIIKSLKAKADAQRTISEKFADWMTGRFGSIGFLVLNAIVFGVWIIINAGVVPGVAPFDSFPFNFLTMVVSLEAIILAITVLISQNREMRVEDLRAEIDLQVDMIAEQEVTKLMRVVTLLAEKNGIDLSGDPEFQEMLKPTDTGRIQKILEKQI